MALLAVVLAACGGNPRARPSAAPTTAPPPVVAEGPEAFATIELHGNGRRVVLPAELRGNVAPLLTAKALGRHDDLTEFGLQAPSARLVYRQADGRDVGVWVGGPTFDNRGVYVMRDGDDHVFMALAEALRPVLALAGVTVPPAT